MLMFLGEMSCYFIFKIWSRWHVMGKKDTKYFAPQKFNPLVWAIPALCDMAATSTACIALVWTYASSFQMLRGSVIIFTGILSVTFLGNKMKWYQWMGIFIVILGLTIVGTGDYVFFTSGEMSGDMVLAGDLLIILAQGFTAIQITVEEKLLKKYKVHPLQGVGWEGIFGFSILFILLFPMYFIPWHLPSGQDFWQDHIRFEDTIDGIYQMINNWQLIVGSVVFIVGIALANYSGFIITKETSATTRVILDSLNTIFVWIFSLILGWQAFEVMQPIGFVVLFVGTCVYYDLLFLPVFRHLVKKLAPSSYTRYVGDHNKEKAPLLERPINDCTE